jgi:predicted ferric reductase
MSPISSTDELDTLPPAMSLRALLIMLTAVAAGAFAAAVILPAWLPNLSQSLLGSEPKAYWYLSRASALVAFFLIWFSMASGLIITNKMARVWPGGPTAFDLHQYTSLLGLAFGLFHALILLGDNYINFTLAQVLVPFTSSGYKPVWVGLGQIGFYSLAIVGLSFYVRKRIGHRTWRLIHFFSFITFALALTHGIFSGTDSQEAWAAGFYWTSAASLLFLTVYRILISAFQPRKPHKQAARVTVEATTPHVTSGARPTAQ